MSNSITDTIRTAIGNYPDPETGRSIESMGQIQSIEVQGKCVEIELALSSHSMPIKEDFIDAIESRIAAAAPGTKTNITLNR